MAQQKNLPANAKQNGNRQVANRADKYFSEAELANCQATQVTYKPFGTDRERTLTLNMVRGMIANPTRSGQLPNIEQCIKFMMLCEAQKLDPWIGDAVMVGYDGYQGGPPTFQCISTIQVLHKRAERCPEYDGIDAGVIVVKDDAEDEPIERKGTLVLPGELLVGGWARVYRKDREHPFFNSLNLAPYKQEAKSDKNRWSKDAPGMITKCAKAASLREAFPNTLGGLYIDDEMGTVIDAVPAQEPEKRSSVSRTDRLSQMVQQNRESQEAMEQRHAAEFEKAHSDAPDSLKDFAVMLNSCATAEECENMHAQAIELSDQTLSAGELQCAQQLVSQRIRHINEATG